MPSVDLYYSSSFLGHFTLIIFDKVDLIIQRVHFVDKGAEASHGGRKIWLTHKLLQFTGFAEGKVHSQIRSSPLQFEAWEHNYETESRHRIRRWSITVPQMDQMLQWVQRKISAQNAGHAGRYGYVIYSDGQQQWVDARDNCGSFTIRCLAEAGITIPMSRWKRWLQLPSVIKSDVRNAE